MHLPLFLDIETIPTQRSDVREFIASTITHPGNIKKPESIAAWMKDEKPAAIEEAVDKTGLDGAFGQVVCIGFDAHDDGEPDVIFGLNEHEVLTKFNARLHNDLRSADLQSTTVVGHNVSSFDLRFLLQRFIVNGIRPHQLIHRAAHAKPWEAERVFDTMVQFAGVGNRISLDKLCLALGLPGKGAITGADVWPMVKAGKIKEVADYCADDVRKTRAVFKRMTFAEVEA